MNKCPLLDLWHDLFCFLASQQICRIKFSNICLLIQKLKLGVFAYYVIYVQNKKYEHF